MSDPDMDGVIAGEVEPTADDYDNMHHALGRPVNERVDCYRNYYCLPAESEQARRFEALGWWDFCRRINGDRDAIYSVNGAGKQALHEWLRARLLSQQSERKS